MAHNYTDFVMPSLHLVEVLKHVYRYKEVDIYNTDRLVSSVFVVFKPNHVTRIDWNLFIEDHEITITVQTEIGFVEKKKKVIVIILIWREQISSLIDFEPHDGESLMARNAFIQFNRWILCRFKRPIVYKHASFFHDKFNVHAGGLICGHSGLIRAYGCNH